MAGKSSGPEEYDDTAPALQLVPDADSTDDNFVRDVIGRKTDEAVYDVGDTASLVAYIKGLLNKGGLGEPVTKTITFANLAAAANLFTITGDVVVKILAICTTSLASAGGCTVSVGIAADPDAILPATDVTVLDAREIWKDITASSEIESWTSSVRHYVITDGNDIIINPSAQVDSGALVFYCFFIPLSSDGDVTAA